jgi:CubicO group peptidase (beta-lactamase class C family)
MAAIPRAYAGQGDWPMASPDSQGMDGAALQALFDDAQEKTSFALNGIAVVRNGFLIGERVYGYPPSSPFVINSITKSVTSILIGIAIGQGKIGGVDQTVGELLPEAAAKAPHSAINRITLAQILTQTSGLEEIDAVSLSQAPDLVERAQAQAVHGADPPVWAYSDTAVSLLGPILVRATGTSLEDYARRALFTPIGIERFGWDRGGGGRAMSWVGLKLSPRDLAKIAWLMAEDGRWRGTQVVPQSWVTESLQPRVLPAWRVPPMVVDGYGYLWFSGILNRHRAFWGWGYGAQFTLLVPTLRLAVSTSANAPRFGGANEQNKAVMRVIADVVGLVA